MTDARHDALHSILQKVPSDFEPYGNRSRDSDWGPDCSCGCRWFVRKLERVTSLFEAEAKPDRRAGLSRHAKDDALAVER